MRGGLSTRSGRKSSDNPVDANKIDANKEEAIDVARVGAAKLRVQALIAEVRALIGEEGIGGMTTQPGGFPTARGRYGVSQMWVGYAQRKDDRDTDGGDSRSAAEAIKKPAAV